MQSYVIFSGMELIQMEPKYSNTQTRTMAIWQTPILSIKYSQCWKIYCFILTNTSSDKFSLLKEKKKSMHVREIWSVFCSDMFLQTIKSDIEIRVSLWTYFLNKNASFLLSYTQTAIKQDNKVCTSEKQVLWASIH